MTNHLDDLLADEEIKSLARLRMGLDSCRSLMKRINQLIADSGVPVRLVEDDTLGRTSNDINRIIFAHEKAEQARRDAAMQRLAYSRKERSRSGREVL